MGYASIIIKNGFRKLGLDVHRFAPQASPTAQIIYALRNFNIDLICDIGANEGQFALEIRNAGYTGKIVSFEPLTSAHKKLQNANRGDPLWDIYPQCALGDMDTQIEINISANSASSSILPILKTCTLAAPASVYTSKETVPCHKLDSVISPYLSKATFIPLYEGQRLFMDIYNRLQNEGFLLWALQPIFNDPNNGRTLQMDGLFFRQ
jgi:FkbM family methyltransferase